MASSHALVVEDEEQFRKVVGEFLQGAGYRVTLCESGDKAQKLANELPFDVIISDVRLGYGPDGLEVLSAFQKHQPQAPVILMTAFGDVENAMKAIQQGAYDYISKFPFQPQELLDCVARALERRRLAEEGTKKPKDARARIREIVGRSPAMLEVYKLVARVASSQSTVLVIGESGTGKELVARAIHNHSPRASGPFVAVNCTAISESLLESELFGHVRGAFTGAVANKPGRMQAAQGGTIFLDEIGEMPMPLQVKLLRVLQERVILRVGDSKPEPVDVRVLSATHRDLASEIRSGRFREDLYYRLNVVQVQLPPLRERGDDVLLLARSFLRRFADELKLPQRSLSQSAELAIRRFGWPGNVRQLENHIKKALVMADREQLEPEDLGLLSQQVAEILPLADAKERFARQYVLDTLALCGGNRTRAAQALGVDPRTVFRFLEREDQDRPEPS